MRCFATAAESQELFEVLNAEGVSYQLGKGGSLREAGAGGYEIYTIEANLPELHLTPTDPRYEADTRVFRLPSGRLIITDLEGNLERITETPAGK